MSKIPISTYIWWNTNLHIYLVEYQSPHISGGIPISTYIRWNTNLHIYPVEYQSPHISGGIPISTYIRWNTNLLIYPVEYQSPHISGWTALFWRKVNSLILKCIKILKLFVLSRTFVIDIFLFRLLTKCYIIKIRQNFRFLNFQWRPQTWNEVK